MGPKPEPPVREIAAVVAYVELHGFVEYPASELLADFLGWRRAIRAEAAAGCRDVNVMHLGDVVVVYDPQHELAADAGQAVADVVDSLLTEGAEPTTFGEALRRQRRRRIGIARG